MADRSETEVAARLARVYGKHCVNGRQRPVTLNIEALRRIADRSRIEGQVWERIALELHKQHDLVAFRFGDQFAIMGAKVCADWDELAARAVANECRTKAPVQGELSAQAAWPFPTGKDKA